MTALLRERPRQSAVRGYVLHASGGCTGLFHTQFSRPNSPFSVYFSVYFQLYKYNYLLILGHPCPRFEFTCTVVRPSILLQILTDYHVAMANSRSAIRDLLPSEPVTDKGSLEKLNVIVTDAGGKEHYKGIQ